MKIELTEEQIKEIVFDFGYNASEQAVRNFLRHATEGMRNANNHTELVKFYMKLVIKECNLPKDYFK
jgi:hypothetical protein